MGSLHSHHTFRVSLRLVSKADILVNGERILCRTTEQDESLTHTRTSVTGLGCAAVVLRPGGAVPKLRPWRVGVFVGFGASALLFVIHGLIVYGYEMQKDRLALSSMAWMALMNLIGAIVYVVRVSISAPRLR